MKLTKFLTLILIVSIGFLFNTCSKKPTAPEEPKSVQKIAFRSDRDGNSDIYIMNIDGSEPTNLTNNPASGH